LEGLIIKPVKLQELYNKLLEILSQSEGSKLDTNSSRRLKARILMIKAKILFLEPSLEIYDSLSVHFKALARNGENYELDVAENEEKAMEKLLSVDTDILVVNVSFFAGFNMNMFSKILEHNLFPKEIIVYNIEDSGGLTKAELQKLTKAVEVACLKNGLIEIKWVEV
jgi:uncharacterized protein YqhQ